VEFLGTANSTTIGRSSLDIRTAACGEWRPDFAPQPGDLVDKEHRGSSGFGNTDLDLLLKLHHIVSVIVVGLLANNCIECTSRFAIEPGIT
jgi:nicotinamidase-related amidase